MIKDPADRDYRLTDADLINFANNLTGYITRDLTQFGEFAVTALAVVNLTTLKENFADFPTDEEFVGNVGIATEDKNIAADLLKIGIRNITVRAENKWGVNSFKYKKFGVTGMNKMNDRDLYVCAKRVHHVGTGFLTELASQGLTALILSDFQLLIDDFEAKLFALNEAIAARDQNTEERIELGNELYEDVVDLTNLGKQIWEDESEAKYNDYVISPSGSAGKPGKIQNLVYTAPTSTIGWDAAIPTADSYEVEVSTDETNWTIIYEGADTTVGYSPVPGTYFARCRGINNKGNGAWSDTLNFVVILGAPNIWEATYNPGLHEISIQWYAVQYSDYYDLYRSVVPIGDPVGEYTLIQSPVNHVYQNTETVFAKTHYYYIKSRMGDLSSLPSVTVSMNIPMDQ